MDRWEKRVLESDAMVAATELRSMAETAAASSPEEQDFLDRAVRVAELVEWTLANVDPKLVAEPMLTQLATPLRQAIAYLSSWQSGEGVEYLTTHTTGQIDAVLVALGAIPIAEGVGEATAEITSLRRSVGQHRGQVDREIESMTEATAEVRAKAEAELQRAKEQVDALAAEVARQGQEVSLALSTARDSVNSQQNSFATAQTERQETFAKLLAEKRTEAEVEISAIRDQVNEAASATSVQAKAELEKVMASKARVEEILGIVSEEALIGTYSKNAAAEGRTADLWRWIAVAAIGFTIAIGIWLVIAAGDSGTDWDRFAAKLALAIPGGGVAAYAASQASEHRHSQREAEHVALQLAALKPYLNDLGDGVERDKLLIEIANRMFGHPRRDGRKGGVSEGAETPSLAALAASLVQQQQK